MEEHDKKEFDETLGKLLKHATRPDIPKGAESRLLAAIAVAKQQEAIVVAFKPKPKWRLPVSVPLAASLLLGMIVGSNGVLDSYLPDGIIIEMLNEGPNGGMSSGMDDVEGYFEGELS